MAQPPQQVEQKQEADDNLDGLREDLISILSATKVSELTLKDKAVILDSKTDPKKAIEILVKNKKRAAPVVDNNNFIGVLDLRDTLKYALECYKLSKLHQSNDDNDDDDN
eukprot:492527_1